MQMFHLVSKMRALHVTETTVLEGQLGKYLLLSTRAPLRPYPISTHHTQIFLENGSRVNIFSLALYSQRCFYDLYRGSQGSLAWIWWTPLPFATPSPTRGPAQANKQAFGVDFGPLPSGITSLQPSPS